MKSYFFMYVSMLVFLTACSVAPPAPPPPMNAKISNYSGKDVQRLLYQECGSEPNTWQLYVKEPIESGYTIETALRYPCINLRAITADQQEIGRQWAVKNTFPFTWVIK